MIPHWQRYVIRPARASDVESILELSARGGRMLTTLPEDRNFLEKRVKRSIHAFYPEVGEPGAESYTFLLEEIPGGALHGISGLQAKTGGFEPFYTYERVHKMNAFEPLGIRQEIERLECRTWHSGPSELGSLYLLPQARGQGVGKLLSLGRLLFAGAFPHRFESSVIAEIRGWQDASGQSPFWRQVIEPFFGTAFDKIDAVSVTGNKEFIRALLPEFPIYCELLPDEVRRVIGKAHDEAEPARRLLLTTGFRETAFVDVFDAGPMLEAKLSSLPTSTEPVPVSGIDPSESHSESPCGILFVRDLDFRAALVGSAPDKTGRIPMHPEQAAAFAGVNPARLAYFPFPSLA